MRSAVMIAAALALAGCNTNRPIYSSPSEPMTSAKPAQIVAGCIGERFLTGNLAVSSVEIADGRAILASADGQVGVRAEVRSTPTGSRVMLDSDWLARSTYEPLVRGCL